MWWLYRIGVAAALALAGPWLLLRKGRHYLATLPGRLALASAAAPRGALWLHAVSVGEVGVAATLARHLPQELPLLVTTITPTGQQRAQEQLGTRATVAYLPFDLGGPVKRFLARFAPAALVLVEGDYWPLLLERLTRRDVPVAVVNGRVGDRSFRRLRRVPAVARWLLAGVGRFGMQTQADADRLRALGIARERVTVTGNLKYDTPAPPPQARIEHAVERLAAGRPVLVAGSTMAGEEEAVLEAFRRLGGGARALLVLAPRHPERWDAVARLLREATVASVRRSALAPGATTDILLLDTLGELAALYRLAAGCFVGGTLVPTGGHNPLEPALFGRPIAVGPSMENFRDMAEQFDLAGAWARVGDAAELATVWQRWLDEPETARSQGARALALVTANRGAIERTLALLEPLLARVVPTAQTPTRADAAESAG